MVPAMLDVYLRGGPEVLCGEMYRYQKVSAYKGRSLFERDHNLFFDAAHVGAPIEADTGKELRVPRLVFRVAFGTGNAGCQRV